MATKIIRRAVTGGLGSRSWSEVNWVVERDVPGQPGTVEFCRYASKEEAELDAAEDGPANRWELEVADDDAPKRGPSWRLRPCLA